MVELLLIPAVVALITLWFAVLLRWRWGVIGLLCFMPFAGMVILFSYHHPLALLAKDMLFVLPLYISLFLLHRKEVRFDSVRPWILVMMGLLTAVVLIECANPQLPNLLVAAIGARVWLFYLPLVFVGAAYLASPGDLVKVNRLMLAIAFFPATIGLMEWLAAELFGYVQTFTTIYGHELAGDATSNFSRFDYGRAGMVYRIPSTFSFVSQYFGFLLAMLVPSYIALRTDPSAKWRRFAQFMLYYLAIAAVLSGSRQSYIFIPLMIVLASVLDGRLKGILASALLVPLVLVTALAMAGLDPLNLLGSTENLAGTYSGEFFLHSPIAALDEFPLGAGTGMDTGAARYAFPNSERPFLRALDFNIESYYVKSIVELGGIGFLVVLGLLSVVAIEIMRIRRALTLPALKSAAAAYAAFAIVMMLNSVKGWQLDADPINVYYWLFAGMACKLPALAPAVLRQLRRTVPPRPVARTPNPALARGTLPTRPG